MAAEALALDHGKGGRSKRSSMATMAMPKPTRYNKHAKSSSECAIWWP
jgi:hypothetical protein